MSTSSDSTLSRQYQQKTDKQHILDNPDTYIGSVEATELDMDIFDETTQRIRHQPITLVPALFKLFDEGIVNERDQVIRMLSSTDPDKELVTYIRVDVDATTGQITFTNDGNGIDVAQHPDNGLWIPEMIFAHLRTSANYNKDEEKIVGGKNGFGIKLAFIWSKGGSIETVDHKRKLKYTQSFGPHLNEIHPPVITAAKKTKPYTRVSFLPDYARLGLPGITPDIIQLFKKRTYDIAAVTDQTTKKIKVTWNGEVVPVRHFQHYVDYYLGPKDETKRVYESPNERWEYVVALSPTHEFRQVSFVNGIHTFKGGKHVEHIVTQLCRKVAEYIEKKKKVKVMPSTIKEQLWVFVRSDIVNPSFDSQTKEYLTTIASNFGSKCVVSDEFAEKVAKLGVMDMALTVTEAKENKQSKKSDGTKSKTIRGIENFIDANYSGTAKSKECTLILCEGLSALSGIVSGLTSADRNTIGIYPLKGKLLNVREVATTRLNENKEINDLKKILGLETGRDYTTIEEAHQRLRYGKVMILSDQDADGSHIKALCINVFHSEWPSLSKLSGFLSFMNTPILRATKRGAPTLLFYHQGEYDTWKNQQTPTQLRQWTIKYFKGLGTSTATEFKTYFANQKIVDFHYTGAPSDDSIDKVFNKKRTDERKLWLGQYNKDAYLDTTQRVVPYEEFIDKELIHFSTYDCSRSIPNIVDGLKTSLRKILYCAFKRRLTEEVKVAQFSGYVSEHSAYHHGEASLNAAIVGMAQNFVGSNNIHLLEPKGQFGTRLAGGDDSASERYIFTHLSKITRDLFPELDDAVLHYLDDDGTMVEPEYYVPILPMVLVNGAQGIGTGFSTCIPSYSPKQLRECLIHLLRGEVEQARAMTFIPYYKGFSGTITQIREEPKYLIRGIYQKVGEDKIRITELPVGTWSMPYTKMLEGLTEPTVGKDGKKGPVYVKDFTSLSTEQVVDITVVFHKGVLSEWESRVDAQGVNEVEKNLKLTTTISTTNMHLFDRDCRLRKYNTVYDIIESYYPVRYELYEKRKAHLLQALEQKGIKLSNRARFIQETWDDVVDLRRKKADEVRQILTERGYVVLEDSFEYLTRMPMDSVTAENVAKLLREQADNEEEQRVLRGKTVETMWMTELQSLALA